MEPQRTKEHLEVKGGGACNVYVEEVDYKEVLVQVQGLSAVAHRCHP